MVLSTGAGELRIREGRAHGFTLVELLVVMAIVALLLTIAMPRYFGSLQHAKEAALKENLQVMRGTMDKFYSDKGRYPFSLNELVDLKYLRAVPVDPITESNQTWRGVNAESGIEGVSNVYSGAAGEASDGTPYTSF